MRKQGMSYSQIKEKLGVNKSTLSGWLYNMPLSPKRIRELRADSPARIERFRNTMRLKKERALFESYKEVSKKIKQLSPRELLLSGFFLYWAEGTKTSKTSICLTNTNPKMLLFYIKWLDMLGVDKKELKVKLHLYSDMDIKKQEKYWSIKLSIPLTQFRKSYIKNTKLSSVTYSNGFGQGTCSVIVEGVDLYRKVMMGIKYIEDNNTV